MRHIRFSYGPPMSNLEKGIKQMEKMISHWQENPLSVSTYQHDSFGDDWNDCELGNCEFRAVLKEFAEVVRLELMQKRWCVKVKYALLTML